MMKLEFINQWRDIKFGDINSDFDYLQVHQEYNRGYLGFYFVILGLGVEIVIRDKKR